MRQGEASRGKERKGRKGGGQICSCPKEVVDVFDSQRLMVDFRLRRATVAVARAAAVIVRAKVNGLAAVGAALVDKLLELLDGHCEPWVRFCCGWWYWVARYRMRYLDVDNRSQSLLVCSLDLTESK